jgi:hypothetical protein
MQSEFTNKNGYSKLEFFEIRLRVFFEKFWIFFRKILKIDLGLSVSGSLKIKFRMISFAIKFSNFFSFEILEVHDGYF